MILTHVRVAMGSLRSTRVRTGLTTLGIIIGVTSVSLVLSLSGGVRQAISHQVSQLSESLIVIKPGHQDSLTSLSALNPYAATMTSSLTEHDYDTVQKSPGVGHTAPLMLLSGSVARDTTRKDSTIIATTQSFADILSIRTASGQFLDPTATRDTVVLGQQSALDLLGTNRAMGQEVLVKGRAHTVIGVLKATNAPLNIVGVDLDHAAFVSLDDGKSFNQGIAQIQQLIVSVPDNSHVATVRSTIDNTIARNHMNEHDYTVLTSSDASQGANGFYDIVVGVTTTVAAISLIVGGIGIMNIMLVSVTERTREIGIRKALGATNRQIMSQFMIESLAICFVGGLIGLGLAYGLAFFIGTWLAFQPVYSWSITGIALGMAIIVGMLFGIYPAAKASRKDPIEALRQYT